MPHEWSERLSEYLDGSLGTEAQDACTRHLSACVECRESLDELRAVVARARTLESRIPLVDLWPGIAARIGASQGEITVTGHRAPVRRRAWSFAMPQLAAAGVALLLLAGGLVWRMLEQPPPSPERHDAPSEQRPATGTTVASFGGAKTEAAIGDLERILREHRGELDTTTVRILETNLAIIDRATEEARRALVQDPSNPYLNHHVAEQVRRKLVLLRQAATLVSIPG